jgi:hypothetical protein
MPPPVRAIDAAKSSLQHLSDQERMITSRLLPPEDPVEAVFKPPEALPHSYLPMKPPKASAALSAPVSLRMPKGLARSLDSSMASGPPTEELRDQSGASRPAPGAPMSYQKVQRWDMLPKHAWLQAAETGLAPGPGYRDVSATQTMRSYGPMDQKPPGSAMHPDLSDAVAAAAGGVVKPSPSTSIASHYSPLAAGLAPSTLFMGLPEANRFVPEGEKEVPPPPTFGEDETVSTFLPLEFFDGGEMEPMPDEVWENAESRFLGGNPYHAPSKFYALGEGRAQREAMLPCEVSPPSCTQRAHAHVHMHACAPHTHGEFSRGRLLALSPAPARVRRVKESGDGWSGSAL